MQELKTIEIKGTRVLTTPQLAELYGTTRKIVSYNFQYNKKKYIPGKHYIELKGEDLKSFKSSLEIQDSLKYAHSICLWTEKGALLHAKSLNTDKAWEVYDYLVDFYFRVKKELPEKPAVVKMETVIDANDPKLVKAVQQIQDELTAMNVLLKDCLKYSEEKAFTDKVTTVRNVMGIILADVMNFTHTKPKLIQRPY